MRYIGGKKELIETIVGLVDKKKVRTVIDIFAGSGVVSDRFAAEGMTVLSNDILYFSYVLTKGQIMMQSIPRYKNLPIKKPINFLNNLVLEQTKINKERCFIWKNYSMHDGCERMYFQEENALKIDIVRITIEEWKNKGYLNEDEYFYLLSRLISAVPYVSNIAGVYGAYLKHWDARSFKKLQLVDVKDWHKNNENNYVYNLDYRQVLQTVSADLLYADPPYNRRQYLPNYHILETIARYDYPDIHGVSGIRTYNQSGKSDFCSVSRVYSAFEDMIRLANVKYLIISYNNEGLISTENLSALCMQYAKPKTFKLLEIPYRRYKSHQEGKDSVCEQLYIFEKK